MSAAHPELASRTWLLTRVKASPTEIAETDAEAGGDAGDLDLSDLGTDGFAWLHDGSGLVGRGVAARMAASIDDAGVAADEVLASIDSVDPLQVPGSGPLVVAALPFDRRSPGELVVPAQVIGRNRQGQVWITRTGPAGLPLFGEPPVGYAGVDHLRGGARQPEEQASEPTRFVIDGHGGRGRWTKAIESALATISGGNATLAKVVLARSVTVEADSAFDLAAVVARLRRAHPSCFTYAVGAFVGASPELLVRRRGAVVVSRPMAGTVARGDTAAEDSALFAQMASSDKELNEHRLVVEAVLAQLAPICEEVSASAGPEVARLATLAHLATTVVGRLLLPAPSALSVAGLLHPTPAVAGWPRQDALAAIAELEDFDRGSYAGPVGWVDARGDGDWAVAVRCATIRGARAQLAAGAGIVAGSKPAAEWAETQTKLDPMLRALVRP